MTVALQIPARAQRQADTINTLSADNFQVITRLAKSISGLDINESKHSLVVSRLLRRLRALEMTDFDAYCAHVQSPQGTTERAHMVSALTTNVTAFFRESHHFDYLHQNLARASSVAHNRATPLRIWCAATSSGEEAFSAALVLMNLAGTSRLQEARVLATDINPHVIATARHGVYDLQEKHRIPSEHFARYCREDHERGIFSFHDKVSQIIRFRELNLLTAWPMRQKFDAIFCRNVAIYFDLDTKKALWGRLAAQLRPGGELYVGHSERIDMPETYGLKAFGITAYRMMNP